MKTVQHILICALLAASTALAVELVLLLQTVRATVAAVPGEIAATREALVAQVAAARGDLRGEIGGARRDLLARTERQAAALRTDTLAEVGEIRRTADRRLGDTLARVDSALGKIDEIRGDLRPTLANTAALTADAKDSWDDLYWDVKASVASATVAANQFGRMSIDVRGAVPKTLATWQATATSVQGIADNVNRLTKPKWYDRLLGFGFTGAAIYRDLNPAANVVTGITRVMATQH